MRCAFVAVVLLTALLQSCDQGKNPAAQYGSTITQTYKNVKSRKTQVNLQQIQRSIQEFFAANGRFPADLNEIATFNGVILENDLYDYDSTNGLLTEKQ